MAAVHMTVFAHSDVGRVRTKNEDAHAITDLDTGDRIEGATTPIELDVQERGILMVVSDGMGGHTAGEVASAMVVDSLRKSLDAPHTDSASIQRLIDSAVRRANADIWQTARETQKQGMGATLTAVLVYQTDAYVVQVGDSRAYLLRSGRFSQITQDQSFVELLVAAGVLTPEQAKESPQKNVILQAMGLAEDVQVSIGRLRLCRDDRLLICCDGLFNKVEDDELRDLLAGDDLARGCNEMIDLANERGGEDNLTAVVAHVFGPGLPDAKDIGTVSASFDVLQEFAMGAPKKEPRPSPPVMSAVEAPEAPAQHIEPKKGTAKWLMPLLLLLGLSLAGAAVWWLFH